MFEHCWLIVLRGKMLRRLGPLVPARDRLAPAAPLRLRASCTSCCCTSLALVTHGWVYDVVLAAQLRLFAAAAAGVGIARYYVLVTWATLVALLNYLRRGVPATWEAAEGTR